MLYEDTAKTYALQLSIAAIQPKLGTDMATKIDMRSSHREETDGTHTVTVQISGIPNLQLANRISHWVQDLLQKNANQIGRLTPGSQTQ